MDNTKLSFRHILKQIKIQNYCKVFDKDFFEDSYEGDRDKLIIELFYFTGMRLSELINIKIAEIANTNFKILYTKICSIYLIIIYLFIPKLF